MAKQSSEPAVGNMAGKSLCLVSRLILTQSIGSTSPLDHSLGSCLLKGVGKHQAKNKQGSRYPWPREVEL